MGDDGSVPTTPKRKHEDEIEDEKCSGSNGKSSDSNGKGEKEEEISDIDDIDIDIDIDSDDSEYELVDGGKADRCVLSKYFNQVHESEGFDIEDFAGVCWATGIVPLTGSRMTPKNYKDVVEHAKYNTENDEAYKYKDFVNANLSCCAGYIYYITLASLYVKNLKAGDEAPLALELFQACVWHGLTESKVDFCRPKPNKVEN